MKKIFTLSFLAAASLLIANKSDAQIYVHARIGLPFRGPRVYVAPPPVVYQESNSVGYENDFPGYAYYDYPAWNGHYRDYYYYAHYRPFFERRYSGYFRGGQFDRGRFQHEGYGRGYANRGGFGSHGSAGHGHGRR